VGVKERISERKGYNVRKRRGEGEREKDRM